jgi:DNA-binding PadR family transcriptional regulator
MKAELLILGVLHRGSFHPYEIKRRLSNAMVECYTDVDVGTLYYAIRQLSKDGLIEAVSSERVARGGQRTVYAITAAGKARFQVLLYGCFDAEGPVSNTLYPALLFLHLADPKIVVPLLRARLARQADLVDKLQAIRDQLAPLLSTGGLQLLKHLDRQRRLDRQWTEELLAEIETAGIRDVSDPRRLAAPE